MTSKQLLFDRPIPQGWQMLTVDEIKANEPRSCVAGPFGSSISSKYFVPEGVPVIRGNNLTDNLKPFVPHGFVFVSEEKAESFKAQQVKGGDLVFTCWGTLGQVALIPKDGPYSTYIISNKQLKLRPNLEICEARFLYYYFASPQMVQHIRSIAIGAAVPGINLGILKSLQVVIPPLPIQRKIAGILSAYDDLIENNTRRIEILEEMARSIFREWFVNFRFPGHEQVQMVDSELGLIPEGWEVKPLSDVCSRITDGSHWSPKTVDRGYPMASVKDMHNWGFHIEQCRKISPEDYENLVKNHCKPLTNDVLVAKDGSYLKHIFVIEKELDLVILSSIALLRPNDKIISHILSLYLLEPSIKSRMAGYVSGVAIPRIILKDFRKFLIVVPPIDFQKKFFSLAEPMIINCYRLIDKNTNLRQTRDLLLPRLISGEIDVENLDINTGEIAA